MATVLWAFGRSLTRQGRFSRPCSSSSSSSSCPKEKFTWSIGDVVRNDKYILGDLRPHHVVEEYPPWSIYENSHNIPIDKPLCIGSPGQSRSWRLGAAGLEKEKLPPWPDCPHDTSARLYYLGRQRKEMSREQLLEELEDIAQWCSFLKTRRKAEDGLVRRVLHVNLLRAMQVEEAARTELNALHASLNTLLTKLAKKCMERSTHTDMEFMEA